jgi:hypothetical protein
VPSCALEARVQKTILDHSPTCRYLLESQTWKRLHCFVYRCDECPTILVLSVQKANARNVRQPSALCKQTPNSTHRWLQPGGSDPSPDVDLSYAITSEKACCEKRRAKACVEDVPMSGLSYSDGVSKANRHDGLLW